MSSRFVSAGVVDATGATKPVDSTAKNDADAQESAEAAARKAEWAAVERRLDEERKKRDAARKAAPTSSLYDMLQANKEAKQAALDEAAKLKNQFRALDEDEIEFLDTLQQRERAEAARIQREMDEGLDAFRRARAQETGAATTATAAPDEEQEPDEPSKRKQGEHDEPVSWSMRKRKRTGRTGFPNLKRRTDEAEAEAEAEGEAKSHGHEGKESRESQAGREGKEGKEGKEVSSSTPPTASAKAKPPSKPAPASAKLLVAYGSDSDSE